MAFTIGIYQLVNLDWQYLHNFIQQQGIDHCLDKSATTKLVVGLSGGVDSIVLLHLFLQLRENTGTNFSAVHVNHGLSQYAQQWQNTIQALCIKYKIPLIVEQVTIEQQSRTSLEQQARDARYQAIANALNTHSILFTGHHQSDQMETFILRLMRGSGLTGLGAMREVSTYPHKSGQDKQLKIARPLLKVTKQDIVRFAQQQQLSWVDDDSNSDDKFDRNYVRLSILPKLFQRWPLAGKSINTATQLLQQDSDLLNEYVKQDYLACLESGFNNTGLNQQLRVLNIKRLTQLSLNKQKAVVRMFVFQHLNLYPALSVLNELLQQISHVSTDSNVQLKVGDSFFRIHKQHLYLIAKPKNALRNLSTVELIVSNNKWCVLPENTLYKQIKINVSEIEQASIKVKWARFDERFQPNKNSGHKKLNKYLKEIGCPTWWRDQLPLIYINEQLIAVADICVSGEFTQSIHVEVR